MKVLKIMLTYLIIAAVMVWFISAAMLDSMSVAPFIANLLSILFIGMCIGVMKLVGR